MRFVSPFLTVWWMLRALDHYVPFLDRSVVWLTMSLYSVCMASAYTLKMMSVWQTQLVAMGTDQSVGNTFLVAEWIVAVFASASSVYWLVETEIPVEVFLFLFACASAGHVTLQYVWKKHLESFMFQYNSHLSNI